MRIPVIEKIVRWLKIEDHGGFEIEVESTGVGGEEFERRGITGDGFATDISDGIEVNDDALGGGLIGFGEAVGGEADLGDFREREGEIAEFPMEEEFAILETAGPEKRSVPLASRTISWASTCMLRAESGMPFHSAMTTSDRRSGELSIWVRKPMPPPLPA